MLEAVNMCMMHADDEHCRLCLRSLKQVSSLLQDMLRAIQDRADLAKTGTVNVTVCHDHALWRLCQSRGTTSKRPRLLKVEWPGSAVHGNLTTDWHVDRVLRYEELTPCSALLTFRAVALLLTSISLLLA